MKRALIVCGLVAWTVVVIGATALWMFAGSGSVVFRNMLSNAKPVTVSFDHSLRVDAEPWMFSSKGFSRGSDVHVKREDHPDGSLRLIIDDEDGLSGNTVTIDLHTGSDGAYAQAAVDWTSDAGPPHEGSMGSLTGEVSLDSINWASPRPLIVNFELHGLIQGERRCVHGEVSAPH